MRGTLLLLSMVRDELVLMLMAGVGGLNLLGLCLAEGYLGLRGVRVKRQTLGEEVMRR